MPPPSRLLLAALPLALLACRPASEPAAASPVPASGANAFATGADATAAGNVAAANLLPPPPPVLLLTGATASAGAVKLASGAETTVEASGTFRVELPVAVADARLSLLDAGDAMVPSSGARQVGQATVLTLSPAAALAAGGRYRLRVDGAATRELHAADGRRFEPIEWPLVVAGEPAQKKAAGRKPARR